MPGPQAIWTSRVVFVQNFNFAAKVKWSYVELLACRIILRELKKEKKTERTRTSENNKNNKYLVEGSPSCEFIKFKDELLYSVLWGTIKQEMCIVSRIMLISIGLMVGVLGANISAFLAPYQVQ